MHRTSSLPRWLKLKGRLPRPSRACVPLRKVLAASSEAVEKRDEKGSMVGGGDRARGRFYADTAEAGL